MEAKAVPPVKSFILAALVLEIIGWPGLFYVTQYSSPTGGTRWLFFFFSLIAVTGLAMPFVAYLNQRFPSTPVATTGVIVRESIWFGMYFSILAWLQVGRELSLPTAVLLAVVLVVIEVLLRLRERSQWKP
jgi:hypothetical protein